MHMHAYMHMRMHMQSVCMYSKVLHFLRNIDGGVPCALNVQGHWGAGLFIMGDLLVCLYLHARACVCTFMHGCACMHAHRKRVRAPSVFATPSNLSGEY